MRSSTDRPHLILVADDDAIARTIAAATLQDAGFDVLEACDGVAALAAWAEHRPDLLLVDVDMPGLDGFAVCTRIRALPGGKDVPIIIVTSFEDRASIDRAFEVGATDFVAKPVNWSLLGHRVPYVLRGAATLRTLAAAEAENRALLEALPDPIMVVDDRGTIQQHIRSASDAAMPTHVGVTLQAILADDVAAACMDNVRRVLQDRRTLAIEHAEQLGDGSQRHVELRFMPHDAQHVLIVQRDISARKATDAHIHRLAFHDALTGLPNRNLLVVRLESALAAARRTGARVAVFHIDLDRFKRINDSLGLAGGDAVLRAVAVRLLEASAVVALGRTGSASEVTVARLAADEFAVLLPDARDDAAVEENIALLRAALDPPFTRLADDDDGQQVSLTQSIGVALFPDHGVDSATLLRNAGTAMQKAKEAGRESARIYRPAMNARAAEQLQLEGELRRALGTDELVLHFQPKYDLETGGMQGAECLLRWTHPRLGPISPAVFIPIAEESGLIAQVDRHVAAAACAALGRWQRAGHALVPLSINLSGRQFWDPRFGRGLRDVADHAGITCDLLEIEITEGVLMRDIEVARTALLALKSEGFSVAIDDFGTGFSSLAYLKQFPLDWLKIDRSFVMDVERDPDSQAICSAIIAMAHRLGLRVVAEGIETSAQRDFLATERCDVGQGYLLGRPQPEALFVAELVGLATPPGLLGAPGTSLHGMRQ